MPTTPRYIATDDASFIRDTHSKALLNTNRGALERHRKLRAKAVDIDQLKDNVAFLSLTCQRLESSLEALTAVMQQTVLMLHSK